MKFIIKNYFQFPSWPESNVQCVADVRCQLGGGQLHVRQGRPPAERQEEDAPSHNRYPGEEQNQPLATVSKLLDRNLNQVLKGTFFV